MTAVSRDQVTASRRSPVKFREVLPRALENVMPSGLRKELKDDLKSGSGLLTAGLLFVHSRQIFLGYGLEFCQCCDWHRLGRQRRLLTSESAGGVLRTATGSRCVDAPRARSSSETQNNYTRSKNHVLLSATRCLTAGCSKPCSNLLFGTESHPSIEVAV